MRWKPNINPGLAVALLLAWCSLSALLALRAHTAAMLSEEQAGRDLAVVDTQLQRTREVASEYRAAKAKAAGSDEHKVAPAHEDEPTLLAAATRLARVVALLQNAEADYGVRWQSLGVGPQALEARRGGSDARDLSALFAPLPADAQWRAARLHGAGEYRSLVELLRLLDTLERAGVAIVALELKGDHVMLEARVLAHTR